MIYQIIRKFEPRISEDKCRSDITTQPKNNNLDCMIDPTFSNINGLFVRSFKDDENDPQ